MSKIWRSAVIGVGVVGEWHTRILSQLPTTKLVAVCDLVPENARKAFEKNKLANIPIYTDLAQMLKTEKLDSVHICTPSGHHLEPALQCMQAGLNVISEKPLEIHLDRVDRMIDAADRHKVRLAGIFQNRWNPANRAIRDAAATGRFGRLSWAGCFTPWHRNDQYYRDGGWRGTWKLDGGGAIMNQSVHAIDLLQWIAGPVKQVSAYAASRIHAEIETEDTGTASLLFENGAFGTILGSTAMFGGGPVRLEIGGEFGHAVSEEGLKMFKFHTERPEDKTLLETVGTLKKPAGGASGAQLATLDWHVKNIQHIHQCWEDNRDAETFGPEARKAVAIVSAFYESARNNGQPALVK